MENMNKMNWKFWKKKTPANPFIPQTATRQMEDIKILVEEGLHGSRKIQVQAWAPDLAEAMFWRIRDGLDGNRPE